MIQTCRLRVDCEFPEARFQRSHSAEITHNDIAGRGSPGVIPILIRLEGIIPRFHGDGCAFVQHSMLFHERRPADVISSSP